MAEIGGQESSSVAVETKEKIGRQRADSLPKFRSDSSKITSKGMGLKRAHLNRQNTFTVNASTAGKVDYVYKNKLNIKV